MAQLGPPSLQKGELLKMISVLLLRCLLHPMLLRKLVLKAGDFSCNILSVSTSRGEHYDRMPMGSGLSTRISLSDSW
jgi:hypothetical protein